VSRVKFQKLTKAEIDAYLDTDEPYDKAGSYAVQGRAGAFVEWIKGDYFNIVGLPIAQLKKYIYKTLKLPNFNI
jgi:septum formation protein